MQFPAKPSTGRVTKASREPYVRRIAVNTVGVALPRVRLRQQCKLSTVNCYPAVTAWALPFKAA